MEHFLLEAIGIVNNITENLEVSVKSKATLNRVANPNQLFKQSDEEQNNKENEVLQAAARESDRTQFNMIANLPIR